MTIVLQVKKKRARDLVICPQVLLNHPEQKDISTTAPKAIKGEALGPDSQTWFR